MWISELAIKKFVDIYWFFFVCLEDCVGLAQGICSMVWGTFMDFAAKKRGLKRIE